MPEPPPSRHRLGRVQARTRPSEGPPVEVKLPSCLATSAFPMSTAWAIRVLTLGPGPAFQSPGAELSCHPLRRERAIRYIRATPCKSGRHAERAIWHLKTKSSQLRSRWMDRPCTRQYLSRVDRHKVPRTQRRVLPLAAHASRIAH